VEEIYAACALFSVIRHGTLSLFFLLSLPHFKTLLFFLFFSHSGFVVFGSSNRMRFLDSDRSPLRRTVTEIKALFLFFCEWLRAFSFQCFHGSPSLLKDLVLFRSAGPRSQPHTFFFSISEPSTFSHSRRTRSFSSFFPFSRLRECGVTSLFGEGLAKGSHRLFFLWRISVSGRFSFPSPRVHPPSNGSFLFGKIDPGVVLLFFQPHRMSYTGRLFFLLLSALSLSPQRLPKRSWRSILFPFSRRHACFSPLSSPPVIRFPTPPLAHHGSGSLSPFLFFSRHSR